jgi:L,D-transpeptidase ErfK/SrfK
MYPEDIEQLFPRVPVNTGVRIVNQPVKAGWAAGTLYVEAHPLLEESKEKDSLRLSKGVAVVGAALGSSGRRVDHEYLMRALKRESGIPVPISRGLDETSARTAARVTPPAEPKPADGKG